VREAISHLDGGDAAAAKDILEEYLTTGACKEGSIGAPPRVRRLAYGSFDLGLALFKIAETFGHRFGEEELDASAQDPSFKTRRGEQVGCALLIARAVAEDSPIELRARAYYLEGNLHFLNGNYEEAVSAYDKALELTPGMDDAGPLGATDSGKATFAPDPVGRDAAYNRAIALRRIEDKKDAGQDASSDASEDAANDAGQDSGEGGAQDSGNEDSGKDSGQNDHKDSGAGKDENEDKKDAGEDGKDEPKPEEDAGSPPPPPKQNQDERVLDRFENAPTVQQEAARQLGRERRRVRGMSDK